MSLEKEPLAGNPSHKYLYTYDIDGPSAPARVARIVGNDKRVLEIGSGPGALTRVLTEVGRNQVVALEVDPAAIEIVKHHCQRVVQGDLNSGVWTSVFDGEKFDVVVAADVLEHVANPLTVLRQMTTLVKPDGSVVLSLPMVTHASVGAMMLSGQFRYGDWGLLDRTHIQFFGLLDIQRLVADANLAIIHAEFFEKLPEETEFADLWEKIPPSSQKSLLEPPHSLVYQCVVELKVSAKSVQPSLDLMRLQVARWKNPYAVPETVFGVSSGSMFGKLFRLPGRIMRTLGRKLP